jgi:hypothetical protein
MRQGLRRTPGVFAQPVDKLVDCFAQAALSGRQQRILPLCRKFAQTGNINQIRHLKKRLSVKAARQIFWRHAKICA